MNIVNKVDLFGNEVKEATTIKNKSGSFNFNPCIPIYGPGPTGTRCKSCKFLVRKQYSKNYYKCELRGDTNGPATDHRVNWPSCGKYEKEENTNG